MCKTVSETIALIEEKCEQFGWYHRSCGGNFGRLELWENHSPHKKNEADRHWYYYTCLKCGDEVSVKCLINETNGGLFIRRKTFMEELAESS